MSSTTGQSARRSRRRNNPRGQGDRLREEIIDTADRLVSEAGTTAELSLREVARRVGIAATSVYLHFPTIDHLKVAVVERGFTVMNQARADAEEGVSDPAQALLARWQAYACFALDHPGHYRLMFGPELPPAAAFQAADSPGRRAFYDAVAGINRCQEAGAAAVKDDPFRLAALAWAAVHGLVSLRLDRPNFPWPPLDGMITQTLRCLLGLPTPASSSRSLDEAE
jgi:AcrR family transcriptional regulator